MQSTRTGASELQAPRYSTRSSSVGSAQWTSSRTTTSGRERASDSKNRRTAQKSSPVVRRPFAEAGELGHALGDQAALLVAFEQSGDRRLGPLRGHLADDLGERQVGRSLAVGDAAADEDRRLSAERGYELGNQPCLADAGLSEHRYDAAPSLCSNCVESESEGGQLLLPCPRTGHSTAAGGLRALPLRGGETPEWGRASAPASICSTGSSAAASWRTARVASPSSVSPGSADC